MSEATPAAGASKGKGGSKLIIIVVGVVALLGGGGGAYFFLRGQPAAAKETKAAPPSAPGIVAFDPFVVNLADPGGSRFLRLTLKLVVDTPEHAKELAEDEVVRARIRSAMLELLALQTADELVTPDGKAALKKELMAHAGHEAHEAHETKVTDVLFSEFVVQF